MTSNPPNPEPIDNAGTTELERLYLKLFKALFQNQEESLEEIFTRIQAAGLIKCHHCASEDVVRNYGDRIILCLSCKKNSWFTADTFFEHMRLACPWLAAIWFKEHGLCINAFKFHKLMKIAYSSALKIYKKLDIVLESNMGSDALVVSSALFLAVVGKRSRETPAREHPWAEQDEIEKQMLEKSSEPDAANIACTLSEPENALYKLLSTEPVNFDLLCQRSGTPAGELTSLLMTLEINGFAQRLAGDKYVRKTPIEVRPTDSLGLRPPGSTHLSMRERSIIATIVGFVKRNFHRISRKYLQSYLAAYWCYVDRKRWQAGSLLEACIRYGPISYADILAYVSPALVKVLPCR